MNIEVIDQGQINFQSTSTETNYFSITFRYDYATFLMHIYTPLSPNAKV